jgi:hypothetical protein
MLYTTRTAPFEVQKLQIDAVRPYAVVATFRSFNTVVSHHETFKQASRRASFLSNRVYEEEARVRGLARRAAGEVA